MIINIRVGNAPFKTTVLIDFENGCEGSIVLNRYRVSITDQLTNTIRAVL